MEQPTRLEMDSAPIYNIMDTYLLQSTKYDSSMHYRYPMRQVQATAEMLMLYTAPGTIVDSYRGQMVATRHSLSLYWTDRYYNVSVNWHSDWRPYSHYVNIATPATWGENDLHFIDLDLDVIWFAESDEVILDDEDEFEEHQVRFGYPQDLIELSRRSSVEVLDLIAKRIYPFDGSLYGWRPSGTL